PMLPILQDVTVVGPRDYCDVVTPHHSLSKRHCILVKTDGLLVIRDLATTNGTKVKGQRVRWAALLPDDRISLGTYKMRIYLGPDDMPSPSEQTGARGRDGGPVGRRIPTGAVVGGVPNGARGESTLTWPRGRPAAGFPEPSRGQAPAGPGWELSLPVEERRAPAAAPGPADFQFEILNDDDEIIELE